MGHYRSEMMPPTTTKGDARYSQYCKIKKELESLRIGNMTIKEFDAVKQFLELRYESHDFNDKDPVADDIKLMKKIIKKCSS